MVEELISQWNTYRGLTHPPATPIKLWGDNIRSVWISNEWGPAVPYPPADHGDGHRNHGYFRIKDNPELLATIPEADWPELQAFLAAINAASSPIESVGCEKGFFPVSGQGSPTFKVGSYFNLIFTEPALNDSAENSLLLASRLLQAVEGCERWWSEVEVVLERFRFLPGTSAPWGLMLRISGYGRDEEEARKTWGITLDRLAKAVAKLPPDFRWPEVGEAA
jgi:hypothetical protein